MRQQIDFKSVLLGLAAGLAIFTLLGAAGTPAESPGRYQAVMANGGLAIVIDTTTGQVWRHTGFSSLSNDPNFFKPKTQITENK